jgi:hypothetical protein
MNRQLVQITLTICAVISLAVEVWAGTPIPVVAHWSFDTPTITTDASGILTAADESGAHNATRTNATAGPLPINSVAGQFGQAAQFTNVINEDATGASRLQFPNLTEIMGPTGGNFSVGVWANTSAVGQDNTILSDWVTTHTYWFQLDNVDGNLAARPRGQIRDTDGTDIIASTLTAAQATTAAGTANLADGSWHHYAWTYEKTPGMMRFYVDGVLANTVTTGNTDHDVRTSGNANGHIAWKQDSNDHFSGIMDELWVFDGLLSETEVVELMESNFGPPVNLGLEVNSATGAVTIKNTTPNPIPLSSYRITSDSGSINPTGWDPISTGTPVPGFPQGSGTGDGWEVAPNPNNNEVVEWFLTGESTLAPGASLNLGNLFRTGTASVGDYNDNGIVDAADYIVWRDTLTQNVAPGTGADGDNNGVINQNDYNLWRANFGGVVGTGEQDLQFRYVTTDNALKGGAVTYLGAASGAVAGAVPEPSAAGLLLLGLLFRVRGRGTAGNQPLFDNCQDPRCDHFFGARQ